MGVGRVDSGEDKRKAGRLDQGMQSIILEWASGWHGNSGAL